MFTRIAKAALIAALLSAFAASSAPAFTHGRDQDFCVFAFVPKATDCYVRADGSCYTRKCDPSSDCSYSYCGR